MPHAAYEYTENTTSCYLDVFSQRVKNLLGNRQSFGEVPLTGLIHHIFPGVVPVEVTDGFLKRPENIKHDKQTRRIGFPQSC